jgi:glycine/D-amino acid oxidase-like deaminating enzyme
LTAPLPAPVRIPAVNANPQGGYIRPAAGRRVLAGAETAWREEFRTPSLDFRMAELAAPPEVSASLTANMTPLLPILAQTDWESEKVGLIAFSLDGEPILGPVDGLPGLYLGCAFHSGGFAYNPAAGSLLADYVADGQASLDVTAFSPNRFAAVDTAAYLAEAVTQADAVRRRH